jgi:hypothetical protein
MMNHILKISVIRWIGCKNKSGFQQYINNLDFFFARTGLHFSDFDKCLFLFCHPFVNTTLAHILQSLTQFKQPHIYDQTVPL